ncbi:unnamed protein product [Gongylonema pulchrum]|uniref:Uncharacterized protein n=1 Tax=Gongylonema pulchrum TaxID=637853 RepID=A0A183D6U5_9BILA|nr:unnamed protein product [Gongylonema pulchrum]
MLIQELEGAINERDDENKKLREKLQYLKEDRDRWKSEHDKAENNRRCGNCGDGAALNELEKDLEERKRTIDALTDSNTELRAKLENLCLEYEKAKKNAETWEARCEKKETCKFFLSVEIDNIFL